MYIIIHWYIDNNDRKQVSCALLLPPITPATKIVEDKKEKTSFDIV